MDVDENILDESILHLLFDESKPEVMSIEEIIEELENPSYTIMSTEEMDKYISDFLEENKGEQSPSSVAEKSPKQVCYIYFIFTCIRCWYNIY